MLLTIQSHELHLNIKKIVVYGIQERTKCLKNSFLIYKSNSNLVKKPNVTAMEIETCLFAFVSD